MLAVERCTLPDNHKDFFTGSSNCSYICSNEKAFSRFEIKFTGSLQVQQTLDRWSTNSTPLLQSIFEIRYSIYRFDKLCTHPHNAFSDFRLQVQQTLAQSIFEITGHALPAKLKYEHKTKKNTTTLLS